MFNLQGGELVIVLLLALVVLGPEKLPDAMRKAGQFYAEIRKMSSSFQKEFKDAVDQPMREVRETANMLRDSADFRKLADGQRTEKPKSAEMANATVAAADPTQSPVTDVPPEVALPAAEAALEVAADEAAAQAVAAEAEPAPPQAFAPPTMEDWARARRGTPTAGAAVPAPAPPPPPPAALPVSEEPPA